MKRVVQISLMLLLLLGSLSVFANSKSIDIKDYKVLLAEKISGWDAEDIKTIKLGKDNDILLTECTVTIKSL